jgi:hypothetical protein
MIQKNVDNIMIKLIIFYIGILKNFIILIRFFPV